MLDLLFVVKDSAKWHHQNLKRNSSHYSILKLGGPISVSKLQDLPAGVYYNTLIKVDGQVNILIKGIKYFF